METYLQIYCTEVFQDNLSGNSQDNKSSRSNGRSERGQRFILLTPAFDDKCLPDVYSASMMERQEAQKLMSVEERWQIIFNEKTRAPIYAVSQYVHYLSQFVDGKNSASRDNDDVIRRDGIQPISYLLRKLKLDLKMSYDSFVEEFIKPSNNGVGLLIKLLKSIQTTGSQQSGSVSKVKLKNYKKTLTDEHDCLLCVKYSLRIKSALKILLDINYGLETVSMSVISTFTKSRGTAIEILTVCLAEEDGFSRILDCFTYIQLKIGEPVRFKSLVNMMNMGSQQNTLFKVCTMKFFNCLLDAATNTNVRVYLQHELETAGLDISFMLEKASGTGLEYDDLRRELSEWQRKYVNVDTLLTTRGVSLSNRMSEVSQQAMIEELQAQVKKLAADKSYLEYQLTAVSKELRNRYEELQKKTPFQRDESIQCSFNTRSVSCQCDLRPVREELPFLGDTDLFRRKAEPAKVGRQQRAHSDNVYHVVYAEEFDVNREFTSDDDGVEKVEHWLRSHCSSDENLDCCDKSSDGECSTLYFKRNSLTRKQIRKAEFPGNWKLIPKSIEQFPSRFAQSQCHKTNCDRCDLRNRLENCAPTQSGIINSSSVDIRLDRLVQDKKRAEVRSQSSDSAIGGSGERLWNEQRNPVVPVMATEAEILQDLIQPDDSASACPTNEPYPDYSALNSRCNTQRSYRTELSKVLREFEGSLLQYESPQAHKKFVTLGDI